jgi:hypothetical protein
MSDTTTFADNMAVLREKIPAPWRLYPWLAAFGLPADVSGLPGRRREVKTTRHIAAAQVGQGGSLGVAL